jgi:hypothetical protein
MVNNMFFMLVGFSWFGLSGDRSDGRLCKPNANLLKSIHSRTGKLPFLEEKEFLGFISGL